THVHHRADNACIIYLRGSNMSQTTIAHNLGFPRIGAERELKKALESYWRGDLTQNALEQTGRDLRAAHWKLQADAGLDLIPTGEFAWYDQVLTLSATLGNIPLRHRAGAATGASAKNSAAPSELDKCCGAHTDHFQAFSPEAPCKNIDLDTLFRVARGRAPT